jgi:hypothetical protein
MRNFYLFYWGNTYLTEAIAESEVEAREKVIANDTIIQIGAITCGLAPYEYRIRIARAHVKTLPCLTVIENDKSKACGQRHMGRTCWSR